MTLFDTAKRKTIGLTLSLALAAGLGAASMTGTYAQEVALRGASMFDEKHAFTKTMVKFAELANNYYDGDVK